MSGTREVAPFAVVSAVSPALKVRIRNAEPAVSAIGIAGQSLAPEDRGIVLGGNGAPFVFIKTT